MNFISRTDGRISFPVWICLFLLTAVSGFAGCQGRDNQTTSRSPMEGSSGESIDDLKDADLRVLFIGNSHSVPLPKLLQEIYARQQPSKTTCFRKLPGMGFLVDQLRSPGTTDAIRDGEWDYVVLQAQKYSTTGTRSYPTSAAIELSAIAKEAGAKVLMYPEWSRRDVPDEYIRIRAIHDSIAEATGAVVAPIGEAWEAAAELSSIEFETLYAFDGNHASKDGSYLNACVFYALMAGESPEESESESGDATVRVQLERVAWSTVQGSTHASSPDTEQP